MKDVQLIQKNVLGKTLNCPRIEKVLETKIKSTNGLVFVKGGIVAKENLAWSPRFTARK